MTDQELIAQVNNCLDRDAAMSLSKMVEGLWAYRREFERLKGQQKPALATDLPKLSEQQEKAFLFIAEFVNKNNYAPSIRELQKALYYCSSSTPHQLLAQLEKKGYIKRIGPRAIEIIGKLEGSA